MQEIYLNSVQAFNDFQGVETLHPMVSVIRVERMEHVPECVMHYGLYVLYLKENKGCNMAYGRTPYDFDEMTVTSFAPGQSVRVEPNPDVPFARFTALAFHPDFLNRTALGKQMNRYEFFDYTSTEALHLSAQEVEIFRSVLGMIEQELHRSIDKHTRELVVSNIELLLNYCLRFYDRQFVAREEINHSVVRKFLAQLDEYLNQKAEHEGLPTVAYFADKCCLSTGYFGTLVKTETGRTAKDIINERLLAKSKELLAIPPFGADMETGGNLNDRTTDRPLSVTQVSQRLGFEYPQHFIRFFKTMTGKTPTQWRTA